MNTGRFTIFAFILAIIALIMGFSACDQIQQLLLPVPPQMEGLRGEIPIGFMVPQTGPLASSSIAVQQGTELAVKEINNSQLGDVRIKLITEDDRSTVEGAVEAAHKLIHQDGVPIILGPATSSATKAVFPIAQENQVVVFSQLSAARGLSALSNFGFRASLTVDKLVPTGI